jgi:glutathione synthase/RimK-type ligase-like ATP-grasp enzyme
VHPEVGGGVRPMTPTVLIATTCRWLSAARLALALTESGFHVEAVCPPRHLLEKTGVVSRPHYYRWITPLASFVGAIEETKPDLIIPCDDLAARHLHKIHEQERVRRGADSTISKLIERSLGSPDSFPLVYARTSFMELAQQEGIRVPRTMLIENREDLRRWTAGSGFPTVLKANATSGGEGVRIVHGMDAAEREFRNLQAPPRLAKAVKWALVDRDMTLLGPTLKRQRYVINAQEFVPGVEATSLVACWKGQVLAGLHFEVLSKERWTGPAAVMRLVENNEMSEAAQKIARRLNLSGLHGFDFMLEAKSGATYLIEINPRATQVGHLMLGAGRDLPGALHGALTGNRSQCAQKLTGNDTIALFPGEWTRNPNSMFLRSGYHDVPWETPDLVRACIGRQRTWKI